MSNSYDVSGNVIEQMLAVSTATLCTRLFARNLRNTYMAGVLPLNSAVARFAGPAFTLRNIPSREDLDGLSAFEDPDHPQRMAVETVPPGHVLVMDCRGVADAASAGSILVTRLMMRGAAAVVADGGLRDAAAIAELDFPAFCLGPSSPTNLVRHHAQDLQVPIGCAGVPVYPGDIVVGDADGVVVVPRHLAAEIAAEAVEQERFERYVTDQVSAGASIRGLYPPNDVARAKYQKWLGSNNNSELGGRASDQ